MPTAEAIFDLRTFFSRWRSSIKILIWCRGIWASQGGH